MTRWLFYPLIFILFSLTGAVAQTNNQNDYVSKAKTYLNGFSLEQRQGIFAELNSLLFTADGSAHSSKNTLNEYISLKENGKTVKKINVPFHRANSNAIFVTSKGDIANYRQIITANQSIPNGSDNWTQAKLYIHLAGKEAVFALFNEEIKAMELARSHHFIKSMSPEVRYAFFAEVLGLLYFNDGAFPYHVGSYYTVINNEKVSFSKVKTGAQFIAPDGKNHNFYSVISIRDTSVKDKMYWTNSKLHLQHLGEKQVFKPFTKEIQSMMTLFQRKREQQLSQ